MEPAKDNEKKKLTRSEILLKYNSDKEFLWHLDPNDEIIPMKNCVYPVVRRAKENIKDCHMSYNFDTMFKTFKPKDMSDLVGKFVYSKELSKAVKVIKVHKEENQVEIQVDEKEPEKVDSSTLTEKIIIQAELTNWTGEEELPFCITVKLSMNDTLQKISTVLNMRSVNG